MRTDSLNGRFQPVISNAVTHKTNPVTGRFFQNHISHLLQAINGLAWLYPAYFHFPTGIFHNIHLSVHKIQGGDVKSMLL
jgi:hypothetical protein